MKLENKSVLVTGGAGFIGSHLVERIGQEDPANLVVVDDMSLGRHENLDHSSTDSELVVYNKDVSDEEALTSIIEEENVDVVFNLAVSPLPLSLSDPKKCSENNIDSVLSLCEFARKGAFDTLVHFSSSEVYGDCVDAPMDEEHPLNGKTPYAASKIAGDKFVRSYVTTHDIDARIIRPFNNFGPRQNYREYAGVIPITVRRIIEGKSPVIYGDGSQTRDFIHVTDTVDAAIALYEEPASRGEVVNIGSGVEQTIEDVVQIISDQMGYDGDIPYKEERTADVTRHVADITRAEEMIDFEPQRNFEENLRRTVDWFADELSQKPTPH